MAYLINRHAMRRLLAATGYLGDLDRVDSSLLLGQQAHPSSTATTPQHSALPRPGGQGPLRLPSSGVADAWLFKDLRPPVAKVRSILFGRGSNAFLQPCVRQLCPLAAQSSPPAPWSSPRHVLVPHRR